MRLHTLLGGWAAGRKGTTRSTGGTAQAVQGSGLFACLCAQHAADLAGQEKRKNREKNEHTTTQSPTETVGFRKRHSPPLLACECVLLNRSHTLPHTTSDDIEAVTIITTAGCFMGAG